MAFTLTYLCAISTLLIHPILANQPPDMTMFLLLNKDLSQDQALSFNSEANVNPFSKGIAMRNVDDTGVLNAHLWYLYQGGFGSGYYSAIAAANENPLAVTYKDQIVIGHPNDGTVNYTGGPAQWHFLQQDDGLFTISTYDERFLGLDTGDLEMPKLYPETGSGVGGKGGRYGVWEIIPLPKVEGDKVGWVTVESVGMPPTHFLVGEQQVTDTVTVTKSITQKSNSVIVQAPTGLWTRNWTIPTITALGSTGHSVTSTLTMEVTPSFTVTISASASPATISKTETVTEFVSINSGGDLVTLMSVERGQIIYVETIHDYTSTSTYWYDDETYTEVSTTVVAKATVTQTGDVPVGGETGGARTSGKKASGGGRLQQDVGGLVVCVLVLGFSLVGVGEAF
ncbi:hypothetical protein Vi05172_g10224 [Venturia inaequalis]|nr:hypothetical protein Vi05172_g10224 [Venturia inaequalis]